MAFGTFSSQKHKDFLLNVNLHTKFTAEPIIHIQNFEFLREKQKHAKDREVSDKTFKRYNAFSTK